MSTAPQDRTSIPLSMQRHVDQVCLRFEAAWKAAGCVGSSPRIEAYVVDTPEPERSALVRELVSLEASYRRLRGDDPEPGEYHGRFPGLELTWLESTFAAITMVAPASSPSSPRPISNEAADSETPTSERGTRFRCPHCHNPIQLVDNRPDEVLCPACGSAFRVANARATITTAAMRQLGKFQLLDRVGIGAFGAVWRARDTELDRIVALKIPHASLLSSEADLERFHREARAAAQLRHPGIATVHEVAMLEDLPALVSDFVHGVPLKDMLEVRRLTFREAATLVAEVAEAVHYAHTMGLIHRDLKPANIMVESVWRDKGDSDVRAERASGPGKPIVLDFGLALREAAEITMTVDGQIIGTPAYMSPEQAAGRGHQVDASSDVYSMGVVLYELLCGELPFRGSKVMIVQQVLHEEPRPPRRLNDKIPRDLETICLKALAKEPARRYRTARELADDLERYLKGEPIHARPLRAWERAWNWAKRRPAAAALLFVSAVAALALVGVAVAYRFNTQLQSAFLEARQARDAEENQKNRAEAALAREQPSLYFNRIVQAGREWEANNVGRTEQLLDACPPDLRGWEWHYLKRLCHSDLRTLRGHTASVACVAYSPDGRQLASASRDRTVRLWDVATGQPISVLEGHTEDVMSVVYSPDGERLASAAGDWSNPGEAIVWEAKTGRKLLTIRGHTFQGASIAFSPDGRRIATSTGSREKPNEVLVWDADTGAKLLTIPCGKEGVLNVRFSPDGTHLAAAIGTWDVYDLDRKPGEVRVWDATTGALQFALTGHTAPLINMQFSPHGERIASTSWDQTVKIWDVSTHQELRTLHGHRHAVSCVAFSQNGKSIASGSEDGSAKIWDAESGQERLTLRGHLGPFNSVAFRPDGKQLASGGDDGTVKLWDPTSSFEVLTLRDHTAWVTSVAFSSDGRYFATASVDRTVKVWDASSCQAVFTLVGHTDPVWCVAFSPDGRRIATASGTWSQADKPGEVKIWDAATGRQTHTMHAHNGTAWSVAFSPDGLRLASAGGELQRPDQVKVWDVAAGGELLSLSGHTKGVSCVAYSPDGKRLASSSQDQSVKVWDATTGADLLTLKGHESGVNTLAFSPAGRQLASAGNDQTIRVWDLVSGEARILRGHQNYIYGLAFSPDGRRVVSGSLDQTIKIWDVATTQEILALRGHTGTPWSLAYSPDGQRIASASQDGTVMIWEATPLHETPGSAVRGVNP